MILLLLVVYMYCQKNLVNIMFVLIIDYLAINLKKSIFIWEKLNYLGFKVSVDGYSATDEKIKVIVESPLLKTFRNLYHFCGAINFYHKTIEKCSELLRP